MLFRSKDSFWRQEIGAARELIFSWHGVRGSDIWLQLGCERFKLFEWGNRSLLPSVDCVAACDVREFVLETEGMDEVFCFAYDGAFDEWSGGESVLLEPVSRFSQMQLRHERRADLCSPVSICNAVNLVEGEVVLEPESFVDLVYDSGADIFGNWSFGVAAAYEAAQARMCVVRMKNFLEIHTSLMAKKPVVVSIRGPICGGASSYMEGHLLTVIGWDGERVHCIDSAFVDETCVSYLYSDFMQAWSQRGFLAYIFI